NRRAGQQFRMLPNRMRYAAKAIILFEAREQRLALFDQVELPDRFVLYHFKRVRIRRVASGIRPPSCSTGKSWLHFWPPPVDFCSSRLAIGAATERARALAMPAGTRAQALQTRL